jgi:poly(3-hydroxybutyrate) depolymerase
MRTLLTSLLFVALACTAVFPQPLRPPEDATPRREQTARAAQRLTDLEKKVAVQIAGVSWDTRCRDYRLALVRLRLEKAGILLTRYAPQWEGAFDDAIAKELDDAELLMRAGGTPLSGHEAPGRHELAYLSPIDMTAEPIIVYVPTIYDGRTALPLLVFMHGYDYQIDKVNWNETMYSPAMQDLAEKNGFLVAMPYGRSNTEFMGVGEVEVLNTINHMKQLYKVDSQRVFLSGASMGGSGAYTIACHYPHLFAAVFAITGRVDYYLWLGLKADQLPPYKRIQTDTDYARYMLENLLHVPVFICHGANDPLLNVGQSRLMKRLLQELGQSVKYVEFEGGDHYIWSDSFGNPELAPWLKERIAPIYPKTVKYSTLNLKFNRAYWVEIDDFAEWGKEARVEASVNDPSHIVVAATNIAALTLRPGTLVEAGKPVTISVNGADRVVTPGADGAFHLALADLPPTGALRKSSHLCGPVRDAFNSRFLIVAGTAGTPEETDIEVKRAQEAAREWNAFTQGRASLTSDARVADADIRDCNLILHGSPFTNSLVAKIAEQLPIKIERDSYVVGDRRVPRGESSLLMVYPNPLNPQRYVLIADGPRWGKGLGINHKFDLVPDFIVFAQDVEVDPQIPRLFQDVAATNRSICAGYFDVQWRLSPQLTWWSPKP